MTLPGPKEKETTKWNQVLEIGGQQVKCKLDTGADVSVLPIAFIKYLETSTRTKVNLTAHSTRLVSYFGDRYNSTATTALSVRHKDTTVQEKFFIVEEKVMPTIRGDAAVALGLIVRIAGIENDDPDLNLVMKAFPEAFEGVGCVAGYECSIKLKANYRACINPCRRVPLALEDEVKDELQRMVSKRVIVPVTEPTEFVSNIVTARKANGKIRVCLDPTHLNKAIERGPHPTKRLEQIAARLSGAKLFSTLDADEGFWQVPLDLASSKLCTFITPWGRYRFIKMPYGLINASDEFQRLTDSLFSELDGVSVVVDDILIWGNSRSQHDTRLAAVLRKCVKSGMVLNRRKCKIAKSSVKYLGVMLDSQGVRIDRSRIEDIQAVKEPTSVKQLQSFLGMTNFVSSFIPSYSDRTAPLRELLKKETVFSWQEPQQSAFDSLKAALASAPVLRYFNAEQAFYRW